MKKLIIFLLVLLVAAGLGISYYQSNSKLANKPQKTETKLEVKKKSMIITSPAFKNNSKIPSKYTCDGKNINPPLEFSDIPKETKSLVLIIDDPDAPSKTWVHWVLYSIPPSTAKIEENSDTGGIQGMTDFGKLGYGGPCPPPASPNRGESGTHRYFFKLYALDTILDAPSGLTKQQVLEKVRDHVIEEAELVGLYNRQ